MRTRLACGLLPLLIQLLLLRRRSLLRIFHHHRRRLHPRDLQVTARGAPLIETLESTLRLPLPLAPSCLWGAGLRWYQMRCLRRTLLYRLRGC